MEKILNFKHYKSLPQPSHVLDSFKFKNRFIIDELNCRKEDTTQEHMSLLQLLSDKQLHVYEDIMTTIFLEVKGFS